MKLKLDENLGHAAANLLRAAGHDVETVGSEGLTGADDLVVIAACQSEARCLVTLDLEFGNPLVFKPWDYAGIVVLRLPAKPLPVDIDVTCRTLIGALLHESPAGKLWSVHRGFFREYRPDRSIER